MRSKSWGLVIIFLLPLCLLFSAQHWIEDRDDVVPAYLWTCGCTPTAAAMFVGYYDWLSPSGRFVFYGKLVNHYFVRYVVKSTTKYRDRDGDPYLAWCGLYYRPIPYANYALAWAMQTDAPSGRTTTYPWDERIQNGINDWTDEQSGYCFWTDEKMVYWPNTNWAHIFHCIQDEIDAWRPCVWTRDGEWQGGINGGHSVACIGYNDDGYVYYRSTWDLGYRADHYNEANSYSNIAYAHPGGECFEGDIELLVPDGGEEWGGGSYHNISWYQWPHYWNGQNKIDLVKIFWSSDSGYSWNYHAFVNTSEEGHHSYSWRVPNVDNENVLVKVEAFVDRGNRSYELIASESSEFRFKLYSRSITITKPNGGETWKIGDTHNITWTSHNVDPDELVRIWLYKGDGLALVITDGTPNDGSYEWQVPHYFGAGHDYKIKIWIADSPVIRDFSDDYFSVVWLFAPTYLKIVGQPTTTSVTIQWQDNSDDEAGFQIGRMVDDEGWNPTNEHYATVGPSQGSGNVVEFTDEDLEFLHKYTYKVRAFKTLGNSDWSNAVAFTIGELAHSDYPELSAFNNQKRIMVGADGVIHLSYYNGSRMYYTSSTDQGLNFSPWRLLYVEFPPDTTVAIGLANDHDPLVVYGRSDWVTGSSYKVRYRILEIADPLPFPDIIFTSGLTTHDKRATPPSIVFTDDSGYVAFRNIDGSIIVAGPYGPSTPSTAVSDWGFNPSIGYDKGAYPDPGRIVVLDHTAEWSPFEIHYRTIGQPNWGHIATTRFWAYGSPSVWIGTNEIRMTFEGWDEINQIEGLIYARYIWTGSSYELQSTALVSYDFDYDPEGLIGYSALVSKDIVVWKFQDDVWYSQQIGNSWTPKTNISDSPEPSSYPQGAVFGGGSRRKLFALWTEDRNGDYYLVRRIIRLPNVYPYIDVAESSTPEATGYNNSQRLIRDTDGTLHLAFTNGDKVYHTFFQGTSWSEPILFGTGKYPSLSLASDGKIHCTYNFHGYKKFLGKMYYVEYLMSSTFDGLAWSEPLILFHTYGTFLWGVGAPSTAIVDTMAYITFKTYHGPHPNPVPGQPAPHIVVLDGPALIYGKYPTNNPSAYTYDIVDTIIRELPIEVDTLEYRDSLVPQLISPSITVDMEGVKHVLWEGDSIQMRYYTINDTITKEFFGAHIGTLVDYPWLTMNEDRVDLFWIRADSIRFRYSWTGSSNLSSIQALATCESPFSSGPYLTWTKQDDYLSYLYYGEMPASGMIEPIEVDYSTNIIGYPQILYNEKRNSESASIDMVWTDYNYFDGLGNIYHLNMPIEEPAPTYVFDMGTETPVPIIVQRDGYMSLGDEDYQTFDYDSTELIYHFTLHTRHKKYKIRWTFYHEEPEKLKLQYSIDDTLFHNRWVQPNEKMVEETWIPRSCLDDDEVTLKVKRTKGTIAVLSGLEIETHFVGGGGPQAGEGQIVKRFLFENMYPNPTKGVLKIRFNSPDEREVTVKIYDVVGRMAEKVFDGKAKVGMNEFLIMPKELSAGVYFVRVEAADFEKTEKIILLR